MSSFTVCSVIHIDEDGKVVYDNAPVQSMGIATTDADFDMFDFYSAQYDPSLNTYDMGSRITKEDAIGQLTRHIHSLVGAVYPDGTRVILTPLRPMRCRY